MRRLRRIYVAGAFTAHDAHKLTENINAAADVAEELRAAGFLPFVPHTGLAGSRAVAVDWVKGDDAAPSAEVFLSLPGLSWKEAMDDCRDFVGRMDAIVMVPGWQDSKGAREERDLAEGLGLPVFFEVGALVAAAREVA